MLKVAAYCRVSTDHEDQLNSFEAQQRYFREYIERQPDWELYDVYADEGITGTSTKKRVQFNRMISDAYEGKFRLILTKEVSRFSRNVVDTITYTRELKTIGVGVLFLTENIDTLDPKSEMLLSFMATLAQEESRKTGTRVVWGQQRQMERGVVFGHSLLGYDLIGGKLYVNPKGAEIVKLIFQKYAVEKMSPKEIARLLQREGYRTCTGNPQWSTSYLIKILNNEKYVGDLVQRKSITPDFLTHRKMRNHGDVPLIRIENHHEPIISRELWALTQETLKKNNKHNGTPSGHSNRYVFSGKIRCGECGAGFAGRLKRKRDGSRERKWSCCRVVSEGSGTPKGCDVGRLVRDDDAMNMLKTAIRSLQLDKKTIISNVTALALDAIRAGEEGTKEDPQRLRYEIQRMEQKKEFLLDSYFSGEITTADMQVMKARYESRLEDLRLRLADASEKQNTQNDTEELKNTIRKEVTAVLSCETESEVFYKSILDHITVFKDRSTELRLNHLPLVFWFEG